jgi:hypothetical protein
VLIIASCATSSRRRPRTRRFPVATLKPLAGEIEALEKQIAAAVREHPDGEIFTSLFKNSFITAAGLLAEIGDSRARYPNRDALAGDAGQAAVAIESGKRKAACFRWGCNKRLRGAFCALADTTRHWHPWAQDLYAAAAPAATTTRARYAPSAAPGAVSCGAAGKTVSPTTPPAIAHCNAMSLSTSHTVGPHARYSRHPADGRRRRHRHGGPQGRARSA